MKKLTFSRVSRLRLRKAFEFIFANGSKTATKDFVMWHTLKTVPLACRGGASCGGAATGNTATRFPLPMTLSATGPEAGKQIGIIASKKTGGAVRRNRLKRLLREAFRLSKNELKDGARLIIYFKAACAIDSLKEAAAALDKVLIKARLKK